MTPPRESKLQKFWSKRIIWLNVAAVNSQMFLVATCLSWTSSAIPKLTRLSADEGDNLGNFFIYGTIIGSIITFFTLTYASRKIAIISNEVIFLIAWVLLLFNTHLPVLYIGRLLAGIAASSVALNLPVYEAECFHPVDRQISGGIMCLYTAAGLWIEYSVAPFITYQQIIFINLAVIIVFLISFPFYGKETPFHLIKKGEYTKARNIMNLFWSKDSNQQDIDEELEKVQETIEEERNMGVGGAFKSIFSNKSNLKATVLALMIISFYNSSGLIQTTMYLEPILIKAQVKQISSEQSSAVIGSVKLIGAVLAIPSINLIGVKKTLMLTLTINSLCYFSLGGYFFAKAQGEYMNTVYWLPLTTLALLFMASLMGSSMLPFLMRGEILPRHLRGPGGASTDIISSVFALAANYIYVELNEKHIYLTFWIYGIVIVLNVMFIQFCVPETKDKTLHEIQQQLK